LDSISSPGLDVSRLTPLCGKSHRAGLAGNRYVGRCWDLQRSRNGFPQWDARLTYVGRPPRDAITVDLARSGADLDFRPDRSDGAIWTACWS
jgi:hypothetical protein